MNPFCPHCGYSIIKDAPIERGEFVIDPRGRTLWRGIVVRMTSSENALLYALAANDGRPVSLVALAERIGCDGDGNSVQVLIHRTRRALDAAGAPQVIGTIRARGYFWTPTDPLPGDAAATA